MAWSDDILEAFAAAISAAKKYTNEKTEQMRTKFIKVNTLPAQGDSQTIYLVPKTEDMFDKRFKDMFGKYCYKPSKDSIISYWGQNPSYAGAFIKRSSDSSRYVVISPNISASDSSVSTTSGTWYLQWTDVSGSDPATIQFGQADDTGRSVVSPPGILLEYETYSYDQLIDPYNTYDEYIWTSQNTYEKIGDTEIDLSDYVTDDEFEELLNKFNNQIGIHTVKTDVPQYSVSFGDHTYEVVTEADTQEYAELNDGEIALKQKAYSVPNDLSPGVTEPAVIMPTKVKGFDSLKESVAQIKEYGVPKYGVSGISGAATALKRIFDAVGATTQVGTDGDNSSIVNDFDGFAPWMWRKCVGEWSLQNNKPKFTVGAYLGDSDYAEDGTMGDYVAVEIPLSFYYMDSDKLIVSAFKVNDDYKAFDIFCVDHNQNKLLDKIYVPAYALAKDSNGYAVSLPGLDNWQGDYASNFNAARTYKNNAMGVYASIMPASYNFFLWAMYTVEFATLNCQSIMKGCSELRSADADKCTFIDATHVLLNNYNANRVVDEYVCISTATSHIAYQYQATHQIVSITRCNDQGVADSSGTYSLIEILDLGKGYFTYDLTGETQYQFAARPWRTGACNSVSTPSGSPKSNSSGLYPMKYRYIENVFGNQYHTSVDLFNILVQNEQSQNYLEWYYLPDPTDITTPTNIANSADGQAVLKAAPYVKLGVETPNANYVSNYIKSKKYDSTYPDIWIPDETTGGTATTYFCDYAYLVNSFLVRSARFGGYWSHGASDGFSNLYGYNFPGIALALYGGDLWVVQNAG